MTEYPTIQNSSKAPRKPCYGFEKLDGTNIRVKYTRKKGFGLFGTRTQLIDHTYPDVGAVVDLFRRDYEEKLTDIFGREFRNEREITVFGEFLGDKSFAGVHSGEDDNKRFVLFDVLVGHKNPELLLPQEFVKMFGGRVPIPEVLFRGNLTDQLIEDVRSGVYPVAEGMLCKGTERVKAHGGVWMAKIKTRAYFDRLRTVYGEDGVLKFGE